MRCDDFEYLNVPLALAQEFLISTEEGLVRDEASERAHKHVYRVLVKFFDDNGLLRGAGNRELWESWVLRFSDFTEEGQRFIMADYPGKWMNTHDRNPDRDVADVRYLETRLRQMRSSSGK